MFGKKIVLLILFTSFLLVGCTQNKVEPSPSPVPSVSLEPTAEPSPSPSPESSPSHSPEASPTPTPETSPSPSPVINPNQPSCVVTPQFAIATAPVELVISAAFFYLDNVSNSTIKCTASDGGAIAEINGNTGSAFRKCFYATTNAQRIEVVSASAGTASCSNEVTINANVSPYPVISSVGSTPGVLSSAVTWTTDIISDSKIDYGLTNTYGANVADAAWVTSHSLNISGLSANTTYHYRVTSCKETYCNTSIDYTFTTLPPTYSFTLSPATETLDLNKSVGGNSTGTRTYTLANTGNIALTGFTCTSDRTVDGSITPPSDCASLNVQAGASANIIYTYNVNAIAVSPPLYTANLNVSHANAGLKTVVITANVTN